MGRAQHGPGKVSHSRWIPVSRGPKGVLLWHTQLYSDSPPQAISSLLPVTGNTAPEEQKPPRLLPAVSYP